MKPDWIDIHTDGACAGNQFEANAGGWGAILEYGGRAKELHGGTLNTTNNRMELTALIAGLGSLTKEGYQVRVFSDSSYLTNCLRNRWYERWRDNGWRTQTRKPVENRDLWEAIIGYLPSYDFRFYLVKGHVSPAAADATLRKYYEKFKSNNGDGFSFDEFRHIVSCNNRADELANIGICEVRGE